MTEETKTAQVLIVEITFVVVVQAVTFHTTKDKLEKTRDIQKKNWKTIYLCVDSKCGR